MTDWRQTGLTPEEIKSRLPLAWVIGESGVGLEPSTSGDRLEGLCPFHDDSNPSFGVFGDDGTLDKCGCWSCDFGVGDLFDYIGRWKGVEFRGAFEIALELLPKFEASSSEWTPPSLNAAAVPGPSLETVRTAWSRYHLDKGAVIGLLAAKGIGIDPDWLNQEWRVGVGGPIEVVVPHFGVDGELTGLKTRMGTAHLYGTRGSKFPSLYGAWRVPPGKRVVVCEGESDTWWVSWVLEKGGGGWAVVGLPRGAGASVAPEWVRFLEGREVVLLFDGDKAGRAAARRWHVALSGAVESVRVGVVGEGRDACELSESEVVEAVASAGEVRLMATTLIETPMGYVRASNGQAVSDWHAEPRMFLDFDSGADYGFELEVRGKRAIITASDFMSDSGIRSWCNKRRLSWWGNVRDAQSLLHIFNSYKPFLAHQKATRRVGWHSGSFVWGTGGKVFGKERWIYAGSPVSGEMDRVITLGDPEGDVGEVLEALMRLGDRNVITPVLGWMTAALVRPEWDVFPPLAVVGSSGTGKTTLLAAVLSAFGFGGGEHNLTSTTPYGASMLVAGSCGVPIWFDEYRPGARKDTLETVNQILRDAWSGSSSLRGGMGRNWSEVVSMAALAPVVISGEDVFSETSLIERVMVVRLPPVESRVGGAEDVAAVLRVGQIGSVLLEWLVEHDGAGMGGRGGVTSGVRGEIGRGIVEAGWGVLRRFGMEVGGVDIGRVSLEKVVGRAQREGAVDPFMELLVWGMGESDAGFKPLVWVGADGDLWVRGRGLVNAALRDNWQLPGGERALRDWMLERWSGEQEMTSQGLAYRLKGAGEAVSSVFPVSDGAGGLKLVK